MKYGNWTMGQTEALINILGGEEKAKAILARTVEVVVKVMSYITNTYRIVVDYGRSIEKSVKAGKYDWANDNITDKNFPLTEHDKVNGEKEMALFYLNETIASEDTIAKMKAEGYRPATMRELLAFGEKHPELQREFPIVALGQVVRIGGGRCVGFLGRNRSERRVDLCYFDVDWSGYYRFLAVRN